MRSFLVVSPFFSFISMMRTWMCSARRSCIVSLWSLLFLWRRYILAIFKRMSFDHGDILFDKLLNFFDMLFLFCVRENNCFPCRSCTSCTTYTMYICFRFCRNIIDKDVRKKINIDTSCSDICRHENSYFFLFEIFKCILSCSLRLIAVYCSSSYSSFRKDSCYFICSVFCSGKYDSIFDAFIFEEM